MDKFIQITKPRIIPNDTTSSKNTNTPVSVVTRNRHQFSVTSQSNDNHLVVEDSDLIDLTPSQTDALRLVTKGNNIFLTGEAGTGKTFLVNRIRDIALKQKLKIAVTAMTGTAAYLLGGTTLHSWANIGLATGNEPTDQLIKKISKYRKALLNWQTVELLVIDEISMMSYALLDKLEDIARQLRDPTKIFGGIQVILIGDFFQLPPIPEKKGAGSVDELDGVPFAFKATCWNSLIHENIVLREIIRQTDPILKECLSEIRKGYVSSTTKNILEARVSANLHILDSSITATRIYPYRQNAENLNHKSLNKLKTHHNISLIEYKLEHKYYRNGKVVVGDTAIDMSKLIRHLPCDEKLVIGIGAQVMLIANLDTDAGLVNGSRGVVHAINDKTGNISVQFINGHIHEITRHEWKTTLEYGYEIGFSQIPLILAWAITVHKAQGASLDLAEIDAGSTIFEYGQAYVALSRVRSLEGLRLIAFNPKKIRANPDVLEFYKRIE